MKYGNMLIAITILASAVSSPFNSYAGGNESAHGGGKEVFSQSPLRIEGGSENNIDLIEKSVEISVQKTKEAYRLGLISEDESILLEISLTKGKYIISREQKRNGQNILYGWTDPIHEGGILAPIYLSIQAFEAIAHMEPNEQAEEFSKLILHEALHKVFLDENDNNKIDQIEEALSNLSFAGVTLSPLGIGLRSHFLVLTITVDNWLVNVDRSQNFLLNTWKALKTSLFEYLDQAGDNTVIEYIYNPNYGNKIGTQDDMFFLFIGFRDIKSRERFKKQFIKCIFPNAVPEYRRGNDFKYSFSNVQNIEYAINYKITYYRDPWFGNRIYQQQTHNEFFRSNNSSDIEPTLIEYRKAKSAPVNYLRKLNPKLYNDLFTPPPGYVLDGFSTQAKFVIYADGAEHEWAFDVQMWKSSGNEE